MDMLTCGQVLMCAIIGVCYSECQSDKHISHVMQELYELPAQLALLYASRQCKLLFKDRLTSNMCYAALLALCAVMTMRAVMPCGF